MNINLGLDIDNPEHRKGMRALLDALDTTAGAAPKAAHDNGQAPADAVAPPTPPAPVPPPAEPATQPDPVPPPAPKAPDPDALTDKVGMPWDERIHARTQTTNQDGTWRYKRGVDKSLVDQVEAELKAAMPDWRAGAAATDTPAEPGPSVFAKSDAAHATPPPPEPPLQNANFAQLMEAVGRNQTPSDQVNAALQAEGVASLPALAADQSKAPAVYNRLFGA